MSVLTGTPDWYHPSSPLPAPLVAVVNRNTLFPAESFGPFFVAPYEALTFTGKVSNLADNVSFSVAFYADAACTISLGSFAWSVNGQESLADVVPVLGAYCKIFASDNQDLAGKPYNLQVTPYVVAPSREQFLGGTEMFLYNGGAIAAGGNAQVNFYVVSRCKAVFGVYATASHWRAAVWSLDGAGVPHYFVVGLTGDGVGQMRTVEFNCPIYGCCVLFNNDEATTTTFYARVIAVG